MGDMKTIAMAKVGSVAINDKGEKAVKTFLKSYPWTRYNKEGTPLGICKDEDIYRNGYSLVEVGSRTPEESLSDLVKNSKDIELGELVLKGQTFISIHEDGDLEIRTAKKDLVMSAKTGIVGYKLVVDQKKNDYSKYDVIAATYNGSEHIWTRSDEIPNLWFSPTIFSWVDIDNLLDVRPLE